MTKIPSRTLVERLREVEEIPDYLGIDKTRAYEKIFEEFARTNSLLQKVIKGETAFSTEVLRAMKTSGRAKAFIPHYVENQRLKDLEELSEAIGHPREDNFDNLFMNPVSLGAFGIATSFLDGLKKFSRREFLKYLGLGVGVGGINSAAKYFTQDTAAINAVYVDDKVKEVYRR